MAFDPFSLLERVPPQARLSVLSLALPFGIPFNRWLGIRVTELAPDRVAVSSPPRKIRQNHLGSAHACALALLGELPAGLLVSQKFPLKRFRLIMGELSVVYHKQGRGVLTSLATAPAEWPSPEEDGAWIEIDSRVTNAEGADVATVKTRWQVKPWERVRRG